MDVAQTKVGFPPQHRIHEAYDGRIRFPLNGRAPQGLWTRKLEFEAEVICTHPHTAATYSEEYPSPSHQVPSTGHVRRAFRFRDTPEERGTHPRFPTALLRGHDVSISILSGTQDGTTRLRHAHAHMLYFVHRGHGDVRTDFGQLSFRDGDFLHLPRGTTYAVLSSRETCMIGYGFLQRLLVPKHYWIDGYPFPLDVVEAAEPVPIEDGTPDGKATWPVFVEQHGGAWSMLEYPFSPFDALAWEGQLYPFVLHLGDVRTLASPNFHIDPKALSIFVTANESASVQVFKPRWIHSLPYPHTSYVTEVLFNHKAYGARPEIGEGVATLHPPGTLHGPDVRELHRENVKSDPSLAWSDEVAVMLESQASLEVLPAAEAVEIPDYDASWSMQYDSLK